MDDTPVGVQIIGAAAFVLGAFLLMSTVAALTVGTLFGLTRPPAGLSGSLVATPSSLLFLTRSLIVGLAYLLLAFGLLTVKRWAWWLGLLLAAASLVLSAIELLQGSADGGTLFSAAVDVAVLIVLLTRDARKAFGRA